LSRLSGAARRKLQAGKALAAGVHRSQFTTVDVRAVVQDELAAQRAIMAAQRERARRPWTFTSGTKRASVVVAAKTVKQELRDVLLEHVAKAT
jgi:hypothetical protein